MPGLSPTRPTGRVQAHRYCNSTPQDRCRGVVRKLAQLDAAWLTVFLCYCTVFGGILVYSDSLAYTIGNNESVSTFRHARHMYEHGIANSSGLRDESFSQDAAAQPYLYILSGASPRLFAYVLYALGIRTLELQIAATVFTVGVVGFWFAYRFLAEISTRLYATVACLLLMTDYITFAQWHVGLWHVWKIFLLFGDLYLAHRVAAGKQPYPLLVVYAFHVLLFYYETIFNVYVAVAVFLYFVFVTRDYRVAIKFGLAQFAGALTAAVVLLGQLVHQFGWDMVLTELSYLWLNVPDNDLYRNPLSGIRVLFLDHAVHTPPWSLVVLAFAGAEVLRRLRSGRALRSLPRLSARRLRRPSTVFEEKAIFKGSVLALFFCGVHERWPILVSREASRDSGGTLAAIILDFRVVVHRDRHRNSRYLDGSAFAQRHQGESLPCTGTSACASEADQHASRAQGRPGRREKCLWQDRLGNRS
jgi:hypothetical protein